MSKRILSILLVLLLCVGILPLGALAADEDEIVPAEEEILNEEIENGNEETIEETPEEIEPEPDDAEPLAAGNINQILTSKGVVLSGSTVYNGESVRHHLIDVYVMAKNYSSYQTNTGDRLLEYRLNDAW